MSVTVDDALAHLHIDTTDEVINLSTFVDAANAWIESKVADTIPEALSLLATLLLIEHWWERSQLNQLNPTSEVYPVANGRTYAVPVEVLELLDGFLSSGTAPTPQSSFPDATDWPAPVEWYD